MGAGASAESNTGVNGRRYFCYACRRTTTIISQQQLRCNFCDSDFIEEIDEADVIDSMSISNNMLNLEQTRRAANATLMLRLIEAEIRSELMQMRNGLYAEREYQDNYLYNTTAIYNKLIKSEMNNLKRNEHDSIWFINCSLDLACNQPCCPICSEEFEIVSDVSDNLENPAKIENNDEMPKIDEVDEECEPKSVENLDTNDNVNHISDKDIDEKYQQMQKLLNDYKTSIDKRVVGISCGHIYHKECVLPWLSSKHTCPICRYEVTDKMPTLEEISSNKFSINDLQYRIIIEEQEFREQEKEKADLYVCNTNDGGNDDSNGDPNHSNKTEIKAPDYKLLKSVLYRDTNRLDAVANRRRELASILYDCMVKRRALEEANANINHRRNPNRIQSGSNAGQDTGLVEESGRMRARSFRINLTELVNINDVLEERVFVEPGTRGTRNTIAMDLRTVGGVGGERSPAAHHFRIGGSRDRAGGNHFSRETIRDSLSNSSGSSSSIDQNDREVSNGFFRRMVSGIMPNRSAGNLGNDNSSSILTRRSRANRAFPRHARRPGANEVYRGFTRGIPLTSSDSEYQSDSSDDSDSRDSDPEENTGEVITALNRRNSNNLRGITYANNEIGDRRRLQYFRSRNDNHLGDVRVSSFVSNRSVNSRVDTNPNSRTDNTAVDAPSAPDRDGATSTDALTRMLNDASVMNARFLRTVQENAEASDLSDNPSENPDSPGPLRVLHTIMVDQNGHEIRRNIVRTDPLVVPTPTPDEI